MKTQPHAFEIDALLAFRKIGVHLEESPIGARCVEALKARLSKSITPELLLQSMMDATKRPNAIRGSRKIHFDAKLETEEGA